MFILSIDEKHFRKQLPNNIIMHELRILYEGKTEKRD